MSARAPALCNEIAIDIGHPVGTQTSIFVLMTSATKDLQLSLLVLLLLLLMESFAV